MTVTANETVFFFGSMLDDEHWRTLHSAGYRLGILLDRSGFYRPGVPGEFAERPEVDFRYDGARLEQAVRELGGRADVVALLNIDELRLERWAQLCAGSGFRSMSTEVARRVGSKSAMRARFAERLPAGLTARWAAVESTQALARFCAAVDGPVVLKPDGLWGSFFVGVYATAGEATAAYERMARSLPAYYDEHAIGKAPRILVEEFIPGSNHSVECVVGPGGVEVTPVVDVITGSDIGHDDMHHFARVVPSSLSRADQVVIQECARSAVSASGQEVGLAHVEVIRSPTGPRLVEMGGRPGINRPFMLAEAFGIDLMAAYVDVLRGRAPALEPTASRAAAVVTPFPGRSGRLRGLPGLDALRALPSVEQIVVRAETGDLVSPRRDGTGSAPVRFRLVADSPDRLAPDLAEIESAQRSLFDLVPEVS